MLDSPLFLTVGLAFAITLLAFAGVVGFRFGIRRSRQGLEEGTLCLSPEERERMVGLLQQLGNWTSEYSGNVSQYQDQLGELSRSVRGALAGQAAEARVMLLLEQIMQSNSELQKRLDAAERQLEKQTRQIESYLSEARTDGLTGLANRRAFDQKLDEMFNNYRKGGRSFALALVDIDHFKSINDRYGHQSGDQALQQVASMLNRELRQSIIVARFGGEEFAVILDGPLKMAADRMNEFRKAMAKQKLDVGNVQIDVTTSVGVSEPREDNVPGPIVRRADEALYAAKNMGRNRTYYHDGKSPVLVGAPELNR